MKKNHPSRVFSFLFFVFSLLCVWKVNNHLLYYVFFFFGYNKSSHYYIYYVIVPPLNVRLLGAHQPLSAGRRYDLLCQSAGSRPPAVITWWRDGQRLEKTTETVRFLYLLLTFLCVCVFFFFRIIFYTSFSNYKKKNHW